MPPLSLLKIRQRHMHGAAIVPQHDIVFAPLMTIDEFRLSRVAVEVLNQRLAFVLGHAVEAFDFFAEVNRFASGFGMYAHDRMRDWRADFLLFLGVCLVGRC